jgi:hypothetical protein
MRLSLKALLPGEKQSVLTLKSIVDAFLSAPRFREQSFRSLLGVRRLADKYGAAAIEKAAIIANHHRIVSQRFIRKLLEASPPQEKPQTLVHGNVRGAGYYH